MIQSRLFLIIFLITHCCSKNHLKCTKGQFLVGNMNVCHTILTCSDFKNVKINKLIGYGAVKWVFIATWKDVHISVSILKDEMYANDFLDGLEVMKKLIPTQYVNQLVGYCEREYIIATEYHQLNNANSLKYILENINQSVELPFKLCINYVEILAFLHNSPIGVRLNCDSDSVVKILSQLLITDQLTLVLSDVDALPELTQNYSVTCGKNIVGRSSTLALPELYDVKSKGYPYGYTDKSDVWKVPDVCNYIFGLANFHTLHYILFEIHSKCKDEDPFKRPSSKELVSLYRNVFENL